MTPKQWRKVWREFGKWFDEAADCDVVSWARQQNKIQRLANAELKAIEARREKRRYKEV
jgi:hypothetical protein